MKRQSVGKRIGVFQLEWPFQIHTYNLIKSLAKDGYHVDVFLHKNRLLTDLDNWGREDKNIHIYNINLPHALLFKNTDIRNHLKSSPLYKVGKLGASILYGIRDLIYHKILLLTGSDKNIIDDLLIEKSIEIMQGKEYLCLIGIEKMGLIWSGKVARRMGIPNIYYSLELYTHRHPYVHQSNRHKRIKALEEYYHKICCATVIQDERRANELYADNNIDTKVMETVYLPVSSLGECIKTKSDIIQKKFHLKNDEKIILYYGIIGKTRKIDELIKTSQKFPDGWRLVLHGIDEMQSEDLIREYKVSDKVTVSKELFSFEDLMTFITSAAIGLVLYGNTNMNDILTAFSSEKISTYLQCGLPIIAFRYPGYEIFENYRCGVLIDSIEDIPTAVQTILTDYPAYRTNAYQCFEDNYQYRKNYGRLKNYLGALYERSTQNNALISRNADLE